MDYLEDGLTIIGRAVGDEPFQDYARSSSRRPYENPPPKEWLSLVEAAQRAQRTVEELKQAIRDGDLRADRRGRWRIHAGDLKTYLYR